MERFEPSTLSGPVFETGAYTVPPHRHIIYSLYDSVFVLRSQVSLVTISLIFSDTSVIFTVPN
jgi:hypothetical protein